MRAAMKAPETRAAGVTEAGAVGCHCCLMAVLSEGRAARDAEQAVWRGSAVQGLDPWAEVLTDVLVHPLLEALERVALVVL